MRMQEPGEVERLWWPRLRWRLRGAWQWPAFALLTVADTVALLELPYYGDGPETPLAAFLLAGFANLVAVAAVAPLAARLLRQRPDLPRLIAADYAGTVAMMAITVAFVGGGLAHRPAVAAEHEDANAAVLAVHERAGRHPGYAERLAALDVMRVEEDLYRSCVPSGDPRRWLCVFVSTGSARRGSRATTTRRRTRATACTAGSPRSARRTSVGGRCSPARRQPPIRLGGSSPVALDGCVMDGCAWVGQIRLD